eukprot:scaffold209293_cov40-Prasinocladus_malaysianus.AAC.1
MGQKNIAGAPRALGSGEPCGVTEEPARPLKSGGAGGAVGGAKKSTFSLVLVRPTASASSTCSVPTAPRCPLSGGRLATAASVRSRNRPTPAMTKLTYGSNDKKTTAPLSICLPILPLFSGACYPLQSFPLFEY